MRSTAENHFNSDTKKKKRMVRRRLRESGRKKKKLQDEILKAKYT